MAEGYAALNDIAEAIMDRLAQYCDLLAGVGKSAVTDRKALAEMVVYLSEIPAAVVIMGPWEAQHSSPVGPALPARHDNLGILIVAEYSAADHAGAEQLWLVHDQVVAALIPDDGDRGEDPRYPVAVLGDQTDAAGNLGVQLLPAGWQPLQQTGSERAAGVLNVIAVNRVKEWS